MNVDVVEVDGVSSVDRILLRRLKMRVHFVSRRHNVLRVLGLSNRSTISTEVIPFFSLFI